MEADEAARCAIRMFDLFHAVEPEHAEFWTKEFQSPAYAYENAVKAMELLRSQTTFFDPERFQKINNRLRAEEDEKKMDYQKQQQKLSDQQIKNEWLAIDAACDAMSDQEFNELAAIAIKLLTPEFAARIKGKNLREVRSVKAEVFKLWQTEQAA